ncbi:MAG TPA: FoF1 ATP synthase subunit gamma, partial [Flavobacteriales bacterium]|nr:FoF1 ATP synthase subunit gamma [Flavobacteriales bacterium]
VYSAPREAKNVLIIAITSNRGLCGAFNNNVIKRTLALIQEHKGSNISVLCIGKKAQEFFKNTEYNIKASDFPKHLNEVYDNLKFSTVAPIA